MADPLNELGSTALRAWATLARAWIEGANSMFVGLLDLAETESGQQGFNEEVVVLAAQGQATGLQSGEFIDADKRKLAPNCITVAPANLAANRKTTVRIRVAAQPGTASGTYTGSLWNSAMSTCLAKEIRIYVVGDELP